MDPDKIKAYKPLHVSQNWSNWDCSLYIPYNTQIAWYAYLTEDDPEKLTQALQTLEQGPDGDYWNLYIRYKDIWSLLLLKLGRGAEAYFHVKRMFDADPDYPVFLHLKTDTQYKTWLQEEERKVKEKWAAIREENKAFELFVKEQQEKVTNRFKHPQHPLVIQHAAILDRIKQCMVTVKYRTFNSRSDYKTSKPEPFKNAFALNTYSIQQLEEFETEHSLHLPDELKVYLMEIGEGGTGYFRYEGIHLYKLAGVLQLKEPVIQEPCLYLGRSWDENQLYIISKGAHKGEVWVHTQTEGGSIDHFDPASPEHVTFLSFLAESMHSGCREHGTEFPYKGAWI